MSIAQEALASIFSAKLLDDLVPGALHELCIAHSKSWEANDGEQRRVNLL